MNEGLAKYICTIEIYTLAHTLLNYLNIMYVSAMHNGMRSILRLSLQSYTMVKIAKCKSLQYKSIAIRWMYNSRIIVPKMWIYSLWRNVYRDNTTMINKFATFTFASSSIFVIQNVLFTSSLTLWFLLLSFFRFEFHSCTHTTRIYSVWISIWETELLHCQFNCT